MSNIMIVHEKCKYIITDEGVAVLNYICPYIYHFTVPTEVSDKDGKKYPVIMVDLGQTLRMSCPTFISFDKSSKVEEIYITLMDFCSSVLYLPHNIKRVHGCDRKNKKNAIIVGSKENAFVSVISKKCIMNNHPLELINQVYSKSKISVRETVRIIGKNAYYENQNLVSITIPSSVESIDDFAFQCCINLKYIEFKGKSKLKKIGFSAFATTKLSNITIPASVEIIYYMAFINCSSLISVSFANESKLKEIRESVFAHSSIKSISFPRSLELIGKRAFYECYNLSEVSFQGNIKMIDIAKNAFNGCQYRLPKLKK